MIGTFQAGGGTGRYHMFAEHGMVTQILVFFFENLLLKLSGGVAGNHG